MNENAKKNKERYVEPLDTDFKKTNEEENSKYTSIFTVEIPKKDLNKLIVTEKIQKQIGSILSKIKNYDLLYNEFGLSEIDTSGGRTLINLYGPPGTGKSFAAEAIAKSLGKKIIRVNYAEIESKFVGDTPKNIREIFKASKEEDAILIFDEADSILGRRLSNVTQSTDHAVNVSKSVMLIEMDNFSGITIFTTNFGENYDSAFVRRIIGHIEFTLPDFKGRKEIFVNLLPKKLPTKITNSDIDEIIEKTEEFSGGDLLNMVVYASSSAVDRDGRECKVCVCDFLDAVKVIKKAKHDIGVSAKQNYK